MTVQDAALEEIRGRLASLERQNRRPKRWGVGALIAAASLALLGQAPSKKTVEANEFILRDDGGHVRAKLSMNVPEGAAPGYPAETQLVMFDEKGRKRLSLQAGFLSGLALYDQEGRDRGDFYTGGFDLSASLMLNDEQGRPQ